MPPEFKEPKDAPLVPDQDATLDVPSKQPIYHYPKSEYTSSFWNRMYLRGVLHRPVDILFILHALVSIIKHITCFLILDIPFLIWTGLSTNSPRHPISWGPFYSISMTLSRACAGTARNPAQLRCVSTIISWFVPPRMLLLPKQNYRVDTSVTIKVHLDTLLKPERQTLFETRKKLGLETEGQRPRERRNPLNPSEAYFRSFLPRNGKLANLPEESGPLNKDGTYTLTGEWIEVLDEPTATLPEKRHVRKKSNVVLLYAHGGGHSFCSAKFHRHLVTRMLLEFGPGARAFVFDYRLSPEDPFPAAIHDVYAAYLYLTQPQHEAITIQHPSTPITEPIDPKDIVLGGDSAGGGLAIGFQLYMRDYVQPSVEPKLTMPPATLLISAWTDISTSMPSAINMHSYCYTPSPMGVNPFVTQKKFESFNGYNFARAYLCGDEVYAPNERNSGGKALIWEWYRHLAQHPLVSPVFTADLSGLESSTLLQTGAFDRLSDDTRLYAHKLGQANPKQRVRLEVYQDMVHVHQYFEFLPSADKALRSIVAFVEDAQLKSKNQNQERKPGAEWIVVSTLGVEREGHDDTSSLIEALDEYWIKPQREQTL